jgi:hypothetical protein
VRFTRPNVSVETSHTSRTQHLLSHNTTSLPCPSTVTSSHPPRSNHRPSSAPPTSLIQSLLRAPLSQSLATTRHCRVHITLSTRLPKHPYSYSPCCDVSIHFWNPLHSPSTRCYTLRFVGTPLVGDRTVAPTAHTCWSYHSNQPGCEWPRRCGACSVHRARNSSELFLLSSHHHTALAVWHRDAPTNETTTQSRLLRPCVSNTHDNNGRRTHAVAARHRGAGA